MRGFFLELKLFAPGNKTVLRRLKITGNFRGFQGKPKIHQVLWKLACDLEKARPNDRYHVAKVGPFAFNFVHDGERLLDTPDFILAIERRLMLCEALRVPQLRVQP